MRVELTAAGREEKNRYHREYRAKKREEERDRQNRYWNTLAERRKDERREQ